jgi:hypothetical protein
MSSKKRKDEIKKKKNEAPSRTMTQEEWDKAVNDSAKGSDATIPMDVEVDKPSS